LTQLPDTYEWLRRHMPLTLLIDLLDPAGPDSMTIFTDEPADLGWLTAAA